MAMKTSSNDELRKQFDIGRRFGFPHDLTHESDRIAPRSRPAHSNRQRRKLAELARPQSRWLQQRNGTPGEIQPHRRREVGGGRARHLGLGAVIWEDNVFITAPMAAEKKLVGLCYDKHRPGRRNGVTISEGDEVQWDDKSNLASPSAATDGDRVYFLFANAIAAACDFNGKIIWKRDFKETHGAFATQWTYGSSPTIDSGKLYIQVLQRNETFKFQEKFEKGTPGKDLSSYILAIDPATGKDIWKSFAPARRNRVARSLQQPRFHDLQRPAPHADLRR
jgi:hypothetical protein